MKKKVIRSGWNISTVLASLQNLPRLGIKLRTATVANSERHILSEGCGPQP